MPIESKSLSLVYDKLNATMIVLEEGAWNIYLNIFCRIQRR
jgi:hypothetical protein